jgi:hypothetical protein
MSRLAVVRTLLPLGVLVIGALATAAPIPEGETASGAFVLDGGSPVASASLGTPVAEADPCLLPADETTGASPANAGASLAASVASISDVRSDSQATPRARPRAVEYSDGYRTRLKIHRWASYATLPIFAAQVLVGQKLYNGTGSRSTRSLHQDLVAGGAVLFGVNTVTGVWNMVEARKDPNHKTKRTVHGILMLAADAGFVATGLLTPHHQRLSSTGFYEGGGSGTSPSTHRAVALASMGVATVSYLMMLFH